MCQVLSRDARTAGVGLIDLSNLSIRQLKPQPEIVCSASPLSALLNDVSTLLPFAESLSGRPEAIASARHPPHIPVIVESLSSLLLHYDISDVLALLRELSSSSLSSESAAAGAAVVSEGE